MVISRFASQLPSLPPDLLRRALSPELHRNSRLACCRIWPWWFVGFVLVVWALAKQGSLTGHGITASIDGGLGEGFYGANGLALAPRQRSLLAAIIRRWTQSSRPARAPTPKELLPKDRQSLWKLGQLACQIQRASSAMSSSSTLSSPSPSASLDQQQQQQQQLQQLQQQAASLMSASPLHGAAGVTPELLDQMQVALEVWEKTESLQARLRSLFSLGTLMYCLGIIGLLTVVLPLARLLGVKVLQFAYTIVPKVLEQLRLGRMIQDIGPVLVVALVRIHNVLLMPTYPGAGLLISTALIAAAQHQRQSAGILLVLGGIALAVLNLAVVLKLWLKWWKWLRKWTLMQPLLSQIATDDAHLLVRAHARGASGFHLRGEFYTERDTSTDSSDGDDQGGEGDSAARRTVQLRRERERWERRQARDAAMFQRERRLTNLLRELERGASPAFKEEDLAWALLVPFILVLTAPLARAHSSQLLGFGAAGTFFLTAIMGFAAVEETLPGRRGQQAVAQRTPYHNDRQILGCGPVPTLAASLSMLLIRATAHAMGVSSELAPFTVGFNVFGSMALLTVSFRYSFESVCKKWASKQELPVDRTVCTAKWANILLLITVILLGAIRDRSSSLFNVGCIYMVLNFLSLGEQFTSGAPRDLRVLLVSLVLCAIGWEIHAHPEFLARALGFT